MKRDDTRQLIKEYAEYWQIPDEEAELIVEGWAKKAIHDAMIKEVSDQLKRLIACGPVQEEFEQNHILHWVPIASQQNSKPFLAITHRQKLIYCGNGIVRNSERT